MVTGTNKKEFSHSNFNPAETLNYHLSIETGDHFLCCAVHDAKSGNLLAIETEKPVYMDNGFQSVSCAVVNPFFTLVPNDIYEINELSSYLNLNVQLPAEYNIHSHLIPSLNAWCVYAIDKNFEDKLEKKYPSVIHRHVVSTSIESIFPKLNTNSYSAWLIVFQDIFVQVISDHGKIKFCNVFNWKIHEDLAYYFQFALEQLNIPVQDCDLNISGPLSNKVMEDYLKKFFRVSNPEKDEIQKRFYTLIHQQACV